MSESKQITVLWEQGDTAVMFWTAGGELRWMAADPETLRTIAQDFREHIGEFRHYRVALDGGHVYAAPGTPPYRLLLPWLKPSEGGQT